MHLFLPKVIILFDGNLGLGVLMGGYSVLQNCSGTEMDSPDSINWFKVVRQSQIDEEKQIALFVITQDLNKDKNDSEWPHTQVNGTY